MHDPTDSLLPTGVNGWPEPRSWCRRGPLGSLGLSVTEWSRVLSTLCRQAVLDKCLSHEDARDFLLCWLELPKLILYPSRNSHSSNSHSQSMVHVHWKSHGWESHLRVVTTLEGHKSGIYLVRESHCHLGFFFPVWTEMGIMRPLFVLSPHVENG